MGTVVDRIKRKLTGDRLFVSRGAVDQARVNLEGVHRASRAP
jgi:hypothetical protein